MTDNNVSRDVNCRQSQSILVNDSPEPSYIENRLTAAFDQIALLDYERQYELDGKYADIAFPAAQLIVECDGFAYHHTKEDRERDTSRDVTFALLGWHVLRFTGTQINKDPLGCALKVKHLYEQRSAMLSLAVSKQLCGEYAFPNYLDKRPPPPLNYAQLTT